MRDSGRFPQFDFHHLDGNLQITTPTGKIDDMDIEFLQSRTQIQERKQEQFTNFQSDDEQTAQSREFLSRTFALKETIKDQKDNEISPLYVRKVFGDFLIEISFGGLFLLSKQLRKPFLGLNYRVNLLWRDCPRL